MADMRVQGATKLIDERGGYLAVANALGWPPTTVHTFRRNNSAPAYRWDAIKALPKKRKPAVVRQRRAA